MTNKAGSGARSGSINRGSDPDAYQNVTDPQHWLKETAFLQAYLPETSEGERALLDSSCFVTS